MEIEETRLKCLPHIPRQGKKYLLVLVAINIVILWFIYSKSNYFSYFVVQSKHTAVKQVFTSLHNVPIFHIPLLSIKDMAPFYAEVKSGTWCFLQGIDLKESRRRKKCICITEWFGLDCGIPAAVWKSSFLQEGKNAGIEIRRREKPRRIILSFLVDDHFDVLDININNAFSAVDLFLTIEEKDHQPSALRMFQQGFLAEFQNKIMPFQLNKSVAYQNNNEWTTLMFNELWTVSLKRLADFRPDDIFLFSHVSSIISIEVLLFLKLYDGYPEPFSVSLRPLLFKFWREIKSNSTTDKYVPFRPSGFTFQFIASMCDYEILKFFTDGCSRDAKQKVAFQEKHWLLKNWIIGDSDTSGGWQCNLCCKNYCLQNAKKYDWLLQDISTSLSLPYKLTNASVIDTFLKNKSSLYGKDMTIQAVSDTDPFFAPKLVTDNRNKYSYLTD